jgi:predicted glycosyltransferase
MKILIDIGHPAHVHYFKNFIKIMSSKGHKFLISSRNKEMEHYLLNAYDIPFVNRGKGKKSIFGKIAYLFKADYLLIKQAKIFKPNLLLSFDSVYLSHVSKLLNIPHIAFDDTEHAKLEHLMSLPFTKTILTPSCYNKDLGKNQIRFNGYMELCYLHHNYFKPDPLVLELLGVKKDEKYIIIRFVSWNASHDVGQTGLSLEMKHEIVKELSKYAKVFISSEGELPDDLKKYQIKIPPEKMHDALAFATLFLGEGATMASECAMLGTPAIYINSLTAGTLEEQEKSKLLFGFRNPKGVLEKAIELLSTSNLQQEFQKRRQKMLADKIDVTAFMVWFIEKYPESVNIMKENPSEIEKRFHRVNLDYQNKFR